MKIMQSMRGQIAVGVSVMLVVLWLLALVMWAVKTKPLLTPCPPLCLV